MPHSLFLHRRRALGLAFRAFVVGAPAAPAAAPSTSSSAAAPVAPASGPAAAWSAALARELVVSLGAAGFRAVLDPVLASPQVGMGQEIRFLCCLCNGDRRRSEKVCLLDC